MTRGLRLVDKFHKKFGCVRHDDPVVLTEESFKVRHALMEEENSEYLEACEKEDIIGVADALGDQLYILLGTIVSHGMQHIIGDIFEEIHRSNMSKLDADGNPIINGFNGVHEEDKPVGKVLKSDQYTKPDLEAIFKKYYESKLAEKYLDPEMKEILEKKYAEREEKMKEVIQANLTKKDWKMFERFEFLADYFKDKVRLIEQRGGLDDTRFGVSIKGEMHWIDEKVESEY